MSPQPFASASHRFQSDPSNSKTASRGHKVATRGAITAMGGTSVWLNIGAGVTYGKHGFVERDVRRKVESRGLWQAQEGWKESSSKSKW